MGQRLTTGGLRRRRAGQTATAACLIGRVASTGSGEHKLYLLPVMPSALRTWRTAHGTQQHEKSSSCVIMKKRRGASHSIVGRAPVMCRAASADFVFKKEEKVLAYHGPLIHEAKVEEAVARDAPDGKTKVKLYLLHYDGWNSHWDEWVPESRVLKDTHDGRAKQKERIREFQRAHKRKKQEQSTNAGKAKAAKTAGGASGVADESLLAEIREQLRLPHGVRRHTAHGAPLRAHSPLPSAI
jgi:hypothetical protein